MLTKLFLSRHYCCVPLTGPWWSPDFYSFHSLMSLFYKSLLLCFLKKREGKNMFGGGVVWCGGRGYLKQNVLSSPPPPNQSAFIILWYIVFLEEHIGHLTSEREIKDSVSQCSYYFYWNKSYCQENIILISWLSMILVCWISVSPVPQAQLNKQNASLCISKSFPSSKG